MSGGSGKNDVVSANARALAGRWLSRLGETVAQGGRRASQRLTGQTKPRRGPSQDRFLRALTRVARPQDMAAAERLIEARAATHWARLAALAEFAAPDRAREYAARRAAAAARAAAPSPDTSGLAADDEPLRPSPTAAVFESDPLLPRIEAAVAGDGFDAAEALVAAHQGRAWATLSRLAEPRNRAKALDYAQRAHALRPTRPLARKIIELMYLRGGIVQPERMFRAFLDDARRTPTRTDVQRLAMMQGWKSLCLNGFPLPVRASARAYDPVPDRSLYCLHNSLPHASAGYAIRSQGLVSAVRAAGIDLRSYTRYGFPWDLPANRQGDPRPDFPLDEVVGDVTYRRMRTFVAGWRQIPVDRYIQAFSEEIEAVARAERPGVIHAASNFMVGLAAAAAARRLGLPVIYEVRGLWEVTRLSREPGWAQTELFQTQARLEAQAACAADRVIAITGALRDELVRRGVPADHIDVVPNSVDVDRFTPAPRDQEFAQQLGIEGKRVVGYIGSFMQYEGLDDLLYAVSFLLDEGLEDLHLLLVGDGDALPRLQRLVAELEVTENVTLTGRVPFADVHRYYSLIDVAPFPRKPQPVTEMVSPLKPFEAMAMEKAVVVSSVAALAEIVADGTTGLIFEKGNIDDLAAALRRLVTDPVLCAHLGANARQWVAANRSWPRAGAEVAALHRELVASG